MADPTPVPTPEPTAPVDVVKAEPTKTRPVVLATQDHITRFVVPSADGDDLIVTHLGVSLGKKQAADLEQLAAQNGVRLIDITPADKD